MAKKDVYNRHNRRNPSRNTKHANPYASDSATNALVDRLLQGPDLDERLQTKRGSKTSATKTPPAVKVKKNKQHREEFTEEPEDYDDDNDKTDVVPKKKSPTKQLRTNDIEESEIEHSEDEEAPVPKIPPRHLSKTTAHRRETSVNSISSTDSSESTKNRRGNKDQRRGKFSPPPANDRETSKAIEEYKEQLHKANKTSQKRHQKIDDLESENDELQQRLQELQVEKDRTDKALMMITKNPSVLNQISGDKRQTSVQQGDDNYDEEDNDDDDDDEDHDEEGKKMSNQRPKTW